MVVSYRIDRGEWRVGSLPTEPTLYALHPGDCIVVGAALYLVETLEVNFDLVDWPILWASLLPVPNRGEA